MSNSEQFCLRWNNHQSTLVSVFENLLDSNVLIDCTLCAEGKFLKAHRVVLSACSPIFKDMMAIQEDKHPIVFLNDVSFLEMRAMLDYMYKGEVNILQDQLDSFLRTAAALQIKGLTDQGGGGTDEPPAKKGPGRKTGMSDAPESPLVGNAPLREGSMSPTRRRRRVPRRPDSADDQSAENSCDIPSAPQTGSLAPAPSSQSALSSANQSSLSAADLMHHGPASSTPNSASRLPPVRKHEPIDQTQVVKQEYVEEPQEDIEDLTLDDDEDYNDNMSTVSDMAKPGTSFHHSQSNQGDFGVDWNPIMANQSGTDDVFLRATEAINNQSTTQACDSSLDIDIVKEEIVNLVPLQISTEDAVVTSCETTAKPEVQNADKDLSGEEIFDSRDRQGDDVESSTVVGARLNVIPTSSLQKPGVQGTHGSFLKRLLSPSLVEPKVKIKTTSSNVIVIKQPSSEVSSPNISLVPTHTLQNPDIAKKLAKCKKNSFSEKINPLSDDPSRGSKIITPGKRNPAPVFVPILPKPPPSSSEHAAFGSSSAQDQPSPSGQMVQLVRQMWTPPAPSRRIILRTAHTSPDPTMPGKTVTVSYVENRRQLPSSVISPVVPNKMAAQQIRQILSPHTSSYRVGDKKQ